MENEMVAIIGQWGIAGLFFIMWYYERRDKKGNADAALGWKSIAQESIRRNDHFAKVVDCNTQAMTILKDEVARIREHCNEAMKARKEGAQ